MHDVGQRLINCFSTVFPELPTEEILKATSNGANNWDSLSWVTLLAVVQEEFEVQFDADTIGSCTSFEGILALVAEAVRNKVPAESAKA